MSNPIEPFNYQKSTNIDEHNQIIDKLNEVVDVINDTDLDEITPRLTADEANISKNASDISQLKISDTEHTSQISTLDTAVDTHAREITSLNTKTASLDSQISAVNNVIATINAKDNAQDAEIQGLSESVVSDLVATFDNSSRKLSLSIERESATPIDAVVTIPAGSTGGGSYSAGDGIAINGDNIISADVDGTTVQIKNGKLTSVGGQTYSAGNGIAISNNVIRQTTFEGISYVQKAPTNSTYMGYNFVDSDNNYIAKIQANFSADSKNTTISCLNPDTNTNHFMGIRATPKVEAFAPNPTYDTASNDAIIPKAGLVANFAPISLKSDVATIQTNLSTLETNVGKIGTSVNGCVNDISVSGNQMTVAKVNGQSNVITLPSGNSGFFTYSKWLYNLNSPTELFTAIANFINEYYQTYDYDVESDYDYATITVDFTCLCAVSSTGSNQKKTVGGGFHGTVITASQSSVSLEGIGSFWYYKTSSDKSEYPVPLITSDSGSTGNVFIDSNDMTLYLGASPNFQLGFSAVDWQGGKALLTIHVL